MGGTGKTTLLNYLREWWQTTHFVKDVFYFGYDESAHTVQYILREIGKALLPDKYDFAEFEAMPQVAQMQDVADRLRAQPYGLILDNLESVTGQELAIQNTLSETERQQLREFLALLRGGNTKVVLGSRSGEDWLADVFVLNGQSNVYQLGGLDPESRSVLAEKILQAQVKDSQRIAALRMDAGFKRLMKLLAGYPLAMEVVLANLARQSPKEILDALNAADVDLNVGGKDKTNNILKCVEYSHSNLSPEAQKLLVCLAPFNGCFVRNFMPQYADELKNQTSFQDYDFEQFDAAIQEAINWGLLSSNESGIPGLLFFQPIFPYFLRTKLNVLDTATRNALSNGFKAHYQNLAKQYQQWMDSKDPNERQLGLFLCGVEYENLYSALQISLARQDNVVLQQITCIQSYFDLKGDKQARFKLDQLVYSALESYPSDTRTAEIETLLFVMLDAIAQGHLESQAYQEAQKTYQKCTEILPNLTSISDEVKKNLFAANYHQLGNVAQELREYQQARSHYQQALDIQIEFKDRYSQARTYHQLGNVAQELREYEQARSHYQQALDIKIEFKDRYSQARTYHQLGMVAQELREYEQARSHYQQALDIKIEFKDRYSQASTYHQLGSVAEELREYDQARSHYQQALDIKIEFNDRYSQANTYHQLGMIAEELREYQQARSHYQQALNIFIEFNDLHSLGIVIRSFARLYQTTQSDDILTTVAQCLNTTQEEVSQLFTSQTSSD